VTAPVRILVVEDSMSDFLLLERNLRTHGVLAELRRVAGFPELETALAAQGWDAVISDYNLPGMGFSRVLARLREAMPEVPVILFSGGIGEETALELLRAGLADFVLKDRPARLAGALAQALEAARQAKEARNLQAALGESESRFSAMFQLSPLGIGLSLLESGVLVEANDALLAMFGNTREQLIGHTSVELGHFVDPADRQRLEVLIRSQGMVRNWSCRARRAGGDAFDMLFSGTRVKFGGKDYLLGIISDVTPMKDAERALQASEQRYRSLFENLVEGFVHCRLLYEGGQPVDFEYLSVNPAFHRITGLGDVVGRRISQVIPGIRQTNPELFSFYGEVVRTGKLAKLEVRLPALGRWLEITAHRHAEAEFIAMVEDISVRKAAELELRSSRTRFRTVFQASPVAIVLSRLRDGIILEVNPAFLALFELPAEAVLGHSGADLGIRLESVLREGNPRLAMEGGRAQGVDAELRTRTGKPVHVSWSMDVVELDGEQARLTLLLDQTERLRGEAERHRLEAEVAHAQKLDSLGALAGGISHDMNNVLAAIMAIGATIQARNPGDPELARSVDILLHAAGRGRDLVKGLRDFVRKDVTESRPLDLNALVRREADLLSRTTLQKVKVELSIQAGLPLVVGEESSLSNALMNLCVNALDAMPAGGQLTLSTRQGAGGQVELSVRDTGQGMSPEVLERAMEPFFTTKPAGKGTGLGLSLVFGILKAHNGRVVIESEAGRGTCVTLAFPSSEPERAPAAKDAPAALDSGRSLEILLVDDDEFVRIAVAAMLQQLGHRVQVAAGGPEALQCLRRGLVPDVVILDLSMPDMDGEATLAALRLIVPEVPVLLATGYLDERAGRILERFPKVAALVKPFTALELKASLPRLG
jgi:PAS domain S-box-containing protein